MTGASTDGPAEPGPQLPDPDELRRADPETRARLVQEALDRLYEMVIPRARLVGFEHRIKSDDRLKEQVADRLDHEPEKTPAEVVRRIPDATRYTFCIHPTSYTDGCHELKARLESQGNEMYYSRNFWNDPEYKGINTRWLAPDGSRFEVQFHTPESFHARHYLTHWARERLRHPWTSSQERAQLRAFLREVYS